jgi:RNA polymerase sigma-70 factor (ECF subfamily)
MVASHHGEIYRYLLRMTRRASDADDLSQETFLRAFRAYRSLPEGANARAWLFTIATNLCRNHFRDRKRRERAYEAAGAASEGVDGAGPDGEAVGRETAARVEEIVGSLPLRQRMAFVQRKLHGMDYDAIARNLQCSVESARAHVFQALRKIRRALDGQDLAVTREPR